VKAMDIVELNELIYKIDTVIDYLKNHNGHDYKLYNHTDEADSDIVEYAEDIKDIINKYLNPTDIKLPF